MEIKRLAEQEAVESTGPVFDTQVHKKTGFSEDFDDKTVSISEVIFAPGERTNFHTHTIRQFLYVTGGRGIVATEDEEFVVEEGDVISIPPEEVHWHGATDDDEFRHISVVVRDPEHGGTIPYDGE
jgi:quercetin dioxygenase-like cupin family protein